MKFEGENEWIIQDKWEFEFIPDLKRHVEGMFGRYGEVKEWMITEKDNYVNDHWKPKVMKENQKLILILKNPNIVKTAPKFDEKCVEDMS
jgi:hypothetical protein